MREQLGMPPRLDARLQTVADCIPKDAVVVDIGTDHGYLMGYLAATGHISAGFATDVHQKPLDKAAFSLKSAGVADKIKLRLCDGLAGLQGESFTHVVMAGMGGDLIWDILFAAPWSWNTSFVLQPMTKAEHLRRSLCDHGFSILREHPVAAGKFVYTVMEVVYTGKCVQIDPLYAYLGEIQKDDSAAGILYRQHMAAYFEKKVAGLSQSGRDPAAILEYTQILERLKEGL